MSKHYRLFKVFGYRVYISKKQLKARHTTPRSQRKARAALAGYRCEYCGADISQKGQRHTYNALPSYVKGCYDLQYVRVLCKDCSCRADAGIITPEMLLFDTRKLLEKITEDANNL